MQGFVDVQSLLEINQIPTFRKQRGSGEYLKLYMGMSCLGIDIYVIESDLGKAKEIISAEFAIKDDIDCRELEKYTRLRRRIGKVMIFLLLLPSLIGIVYAGVMLLTSLFRF